MLLIIALGLWPALPATAAAQAYSIPSGNPFASTPGAAPEVFVYGMRNPYRWAFDRLTGDMYIGDVGGINEELTFLPRARQAGANLGWNCLSGTAVQSSCDPPGDVLPAFEYPSSGDVIIGGPVLRDPALPGFAGRSIYARFNNGVFLRGPGGTGDEVPAGSLGISSVSGFGEDGEGHLYVTSLGGAVNRLVQSGSSLDKSKVGDFNQPLAVAAPPGDPNRLYVVEKPGTIRNRDGSLLLDLTEQVEETGEQGLLAMAVAPDFATSNRFFVFYTDNGGDLQLDEFRRTAAGPDRSERSTRRPLLTIQHDQADNHNGGQLLFGPDNLLYLSTGDGGTQGDPEGDAQNLGSLLGKILRIDVGVAGPPPVAPAPVAPPAGADNVRPRLRTRVPRRQRVLRQRGAIAYVDCDERCSIRAGGVLRIGKRRYGMVRASRAAQSRGGRGSTGPRMKVRLTRKARRALRRALRHGRHPQVRLGLRGTDSAGNRSALVRRTVRVRR